jgi:cob(I)alamin adenosyltransferase
MERMEKLYTSTGDDGFTGLLGEGRVPKYHPRTEAVGALDEASAALGLARAVCENPRSKLLLLEIQRDLYHIMAEISATPENAEKFRKITSDRVSWLEGEVDALTASVEMPKEFIVPGDTQAGACVALARTITRRAERWLARLLHDHEIENGELLRYLNRLSSLCFILELVENQTAGRAKPTLAKSKG